MARSQRPVEGQLTLFDADTDARHEVPATEPEREPRRRDSDSPRHSDEQPEHEREPRTVRWREWVQDRVEFPDVVELPSAAKRPPTVAGSAMVRTLAAIYERCLASRGVVLSWHELGSEAGLSADHAKRAALALEQVEAIAIHRRAGKSRPHTFELLWPGIRRRVPRIKVVDEPDEFREVQPMHVQGLARAQPMHQRPHQPVHGATLSSSPTDECDECHQGDWLGHVEPDDLRDAEWLSATLSRAVAAGFPVTLPFLKRAATSALGGRVPGAMFRTIVERGDDRSTRRPDPQTHDRPTRYAAANHPSQAAAREGSGRR